MTADAGLWIAERAGHHISQAFGLRPGMAVVTSGDGIRYDARMSLVHGLRQARHISSSRCADGVGRMAFGAQYGAATHQRTAMPGGIVVLVFLIMLLENVLLYGR